MHYIYIYILYYNIYIYMFICISSHFMPWFKRKRMNTLTKNTGAWSGSHLLVDPMIMCRSRGFETRYMTQIKLGYIMIWCYNHMLKLYHTPSNLFSLPCVWIVIRSPIRVEFGMYSSHLIDGITIQTYRIFICLGIGCIKGFSKFIDGNHTNFLVCTSSTLKLSIQYSCYLSQVLPIYYRAPWFSWQKNMCIAIYAYLPIYV